MFSSNLLKGVFFGILAIMASAASGATGSTHELAFSLRYESLKSPTGVNANTELQGAYLVPIKAIWAGGELAYATSKNPTYATNSLEAGGLIKYWVMDPGQGFSFNLFSGLSLGKENNGFTSNSTMTIKAGPEFAYFAWDGVSISTKVQYSSRKAGVSYKGLGIYSGLSLFF